MFQCRYTGTYMFLRVCLQFRVRLIIRFVSRSQFFREFFREIHKICFDFVLGWLKNSLQNYFYPFSPFSTLLQTKTAWNPESFRDVLEKNQNIFCQCQTTLRYYLIVRRTLVCMGSIRNFI